MSLKNSLKRCIVCDCKSLPFKNLTNDELLFINKERAEVNYKKGEIIFKQGALALNIVYIKDGLVKTYKEHGQEELVLSLESKGKMVGLQTLFSDSLYPYSVKAYNDVSVCLIDKKAIMKLATQNAAFSASLLKLSNQDSLFMFDRMTCLSLKQLHGRFADLLLCLSLKIYKRDKFIVPLSKKDMSRIMNISQESVSRVIKDFKDEKIVEISGNEISILNFDKVRQFSQVG